MKTCVWMVVAGWLMIGTAMGNLVAGPNGGRIVGEDPDRAEVVIRDDGTLEVAFLDAGDQPVPAGARTVSVHAQMDGGRKEVVMKESGGKLVSQEPLPRPEGYTLVIQLRAHADAKPVNARIQFMTHVCGGCHLKEYACTCEGH